MGYSLIVILDVPFGAALSLLGWLFVSMVGTAAFGYFINDWSDIVPDRMAGKRNFAAQNSTEKNLAILGLLMTIALAPWYFLPKNPYNTGFYLLQLLLLILYSVPPFRLKRYSIACILTDALYNSAVPFLIVFWTFFDMKSLQPFPQLSVLFLLVLALTFIKGIRGIMLHQVGDRKNDRKTNITSFVNYYGPGWSFNFVFVCVLRIEILLFLTVIVYLSLGNFPYLWLIIPLFIIYLFLFFRLWERYRLRRRALRFAMVSIINDLYEEWLPIVVLVYLAVLNPWYIMILIIHLLLFYGIVVKMYRNMKKIPGNLYDFVVFSAWKAASVIRPKVINREN